MVAAVLKLYAIGTAFSVLAFIYGLVDSFGGLMYSPDHPYIYELEHQMHRQLHHGRRLSVTKNIGS